MIIKDGKFEILCRLPPITIMQNPQWLKMNIEAYFNEQPIMSFLEAINDDNPTLEGAKKAIKEDAKEILKAMKMPTPEEFARYIGFANFNSLKKAAENADFPEDSRHYLLVGCSLIADLLTRSGLSSRLNPKFTQFIMSAYLGINEKVEMTTDETNRVIIQWNTPNDFIVPKLISTLPNTNQQVQQYLINNPPDPLEMELDRLERALPNDMRLPVYKTKEVVTTEDLEG